MPGTVRLHRVFATTPEKIYRAFLEPDALAKWLPPNGFAATVFHHEAKVGGRFRAAFRNFTTSQNQGFSGVYTELKPDELIRYTDKFDDASMPGEMHVTVNLRKVAVGAEISILHEGIPDAIPEEGCYLGWQDSLDNLKRLVEPEINQ